MTIRVHLPDCVWAGERLSPAMSCHCNSAFGQAIERVSMKVSEDARAWLPCDLNGEPIQSVSDDIRLIINTIQTSNKQDI